MRTRFPSQPRAQLPLSFSENKESSPVHNHPDSPEPPGHAFLRKNKPAQMTALVLSPPREAVTTLLEALEAVDAVPLRDAALHASKVAFQDPALAWQSELAEADNMRGNRFERDMHDQDFAREVFLVLLSAGVLLRSILEATLQPDKAEMLQRDVEHIEQSLGTVLSGQVEAVRGFIAQMIEYVDVNVPTDHLDTAKLFMAIREPISECLSGVLKQPFADYCKTALETPLRQALTMTRKHIKGHCFALPSGEADLFTEDPGAAFQVICSWDPHKLRALLTKERTHLANFMVEEVLRTYTEPNAQEKILDLYRLFRQFRARQLREARSRRGA